MKQKLILSLLFVMIFMNAVEAEEILPSPKSIILAENETLESKSQEILAALRYAAFWNTGDQHYAEEALDPDFMDRTLPDGRKQGPNGPLEASKMFRSAIPDLKIDIEKMIVADDHVVLHLNFEGHFLGTFQEFEGNGELISFRATDIYKIKNGKITDNWHLEDNLKLFQQMGILK